METANETNSSQEEQTPSVFSWWAACGLITAIAAFWRFYDLTLKPLHHDEGVNGHFLMTLFREGIYKYDPSNYHGPTLYYISLAFTKIFGLETGAIRASVGVFGVLMVAMFFALRRYLGNVGALSAAVLVALSPGMVYISRYFIHEIFFVMCSLGIVLGVLFFIEGRKPGFFAISAMTMTMLVCFMPPVMHVENLVPSGQPGLVPVFRIVIFALEAFLVFFLMRIILGWDEGRPVYLLLASTSLALFFATKETAFITIGTMIIACFCVWIWRKIYVGVFGKIQTNELEPLQLTWSRFIERSRAAGLPVLVAASVTVFAYVSVVFFSSFFTYWEGVPAAFEAYAFWTKTGTGDHTQNGYLGYVKWLMKVESPIVILCAIGTIIAFVKGRHIFAMFAGLWAFGLFAAYTIIPYKTPWLALSFILPMCLVGGYAINEIFKVRDVAFKGLAAVLLLAAFAVLSFQTYDLNFVRYDDDEMPYVYAHTSRGFHDLMSEVDRYAAKSGKGTTATVEVVSNEYWPMPWYTRKYTNVNYQGRLVDVNSAEMIIGKSEENDAKLAARYGTHYRKAGVYPLRPGVELVLLVRRDLADADTKSLNSQLSEPPAVEQRPEIMATPASKK